MSDGVQVAVDVGGTFTDVVAHSTSDGRTAIAKTLSTPEAPSVGVLEGIRIALRESGYGLKDVASLRHGTTIATNAVLERKTAKTALIVTKGFKDILYVGRQARPSLYDLGARHPAPLAPRHLTFELDERIAWSGEVEKPVAPDEVGEIARRLKSEAVESAAICLIHAYVNP
ncbi:MAG: hydantoinase/oxoprolinase family protein, partial [Rhodospirillaceae bacterium]|nr:hydantoinase/oxoprolinase family protein [Rhodospirillaceae bacterium]